MGSSERPEETASLSGASRSWPSAAFPVLAILLVGYADPSPTAAGENEGFAVVVTGEILAVRNDSGRITQVRLRKADGRFLRVELDGYGALLGVKHSGRFAEVTGQVYLKQTGGEQVRWIRVKRFRLVPRPPDWVDSELICHEVEDEPDILEEEEDEEVDDAGPPAPDGEEP